MLCVLVLYILINIPPSFGMYFWCSCHLTEQAKLSVLKTTNHINGLTLYIGKIILTPMTGLTYSIETNSTLLIISDCCCY